MKTALIFGVFDKLHKGHFDLFNQIKNQGFNISVCLALDEIVKYRKGQTPIQSFHERKQALESTDGINKVVAGDKQERTFSAIESENPDVIAIGYDQIELSRAIEKWLKDKQIIIPLIFLRAFEPEKYKSSLLRN